MGKKQNSIEMSTVRKGLTGQRKSGSFSQCHTLTPISQSQRAQLNPPRLCRAGSQNTECVKFQSPVSLYTNGPSTAEGPRLTWAQRELQPKEPSPPSPAPPGAVAPHPCPSFRVSQVCVGGDGGDRSQQRLQRTPYCHQACQPLGPPHLQP